MPTKDIPFNTFKSNTELPECISGGWYLSGNTLCPTKEATFDGLCEIISCYKSIMSGSVFVKHDNYFTLFQITNNGNVQCFRILKNEMEKVPTETCPGCEELPYQGYNNKNKWCQFSRMIANNQG